MKCPICGTEIIANPNHVHEVTWEHIFYTHHDRKLADKIKMDILFKRYKLP